MEDTVQIKNNIKKYYKSVKNLPIPEKYIGVELKKLGVPNPQSPCEILNFVH